MCIIVYMWVCVLLRLELVSLAGLLASYLGWGASVQIDEGAGSRCGKSIYLLVVV